MRFDHYRVKPHSNVQYTGSTATSSDFALSPRLMLAYQMLPSVNVYAQYARGFQSPFSSDLYFNYIGHHSRFASFKITSNPNLKSETSDSFELGVRGQLTHPGLFADENFIDYSASVFTGKYKNFIGNHEENIVRPDGVYMQGTLANYHRVNPYGFEGRLGWQINQALHLRTALTWTKGKQQTTTSSQTIPLEDISPLTAIAGLKYAPNNRWHVRSDIIYQAAKNENNVPKPDNPNWQKYLPPSSTVINVSTGYRFNRFATLNMGIFNILDRKYWQWSDVRNVCASDSYAIEASSAAG